MVLGHIVQDLVACEGRVRSTRVLFRREKQEEAVSRPWQ